MEENAQPPLIEAPPPVAPLAPPPPPPPLMPPPLIAPASPTPLPRRGRGWMVFALVLLLLLGLSLFYNVNHLFSNVLHGRGVKYSSRAVGPRLDEVTTEDNDAVNKIAVVEVKGVITSQTIGQDGYSMVEVIKAELKRAEEDERVKAVILKVDSPGGEVLASDEIYRAISDFQKNDKAGKPVIAAMGDLAASGGYYVSTPCRWIVANELTITGSIGVIMHSWNYRGLMDKVGLRPEVYKSGKFKDMLSPEREPEQITPEEREMVQSLINETYARFKSVVQAGREQAHKKNKDQGHPLSTDWKDYADGRVLSGREALKHGFVDELGNFEDAVSRAKGLAGISNANLIEYQQRYDLSDLFHLFGKSEGRVLKLDLGADFPKLRAGQPYFLSPSFVR
jgi:protease-4